MMGALKHYNIPKKLFELFSLPGRRDKKRISTVFCMLQETNALKRLVIVSVEAFSVIPAEL